jgi:hypothetical protein
MTMTESYFTARVTSPELESVFGWLEVRWENGDFSGHHVAVGLLESAMEYRSVTHFGRTWSGKEIATHIIPAMELVRQVFSMAEIQPGPKGPPPPLPPRPIA